MTDSPIPRATSITHEHLLSVVHTHTRGLGPDRPVRILDAGCGAGQLIAYLSENLPRLNPSLTFQLYGFDVAGHGVQLDDYFEETRRRLSEACAEVDWSERLALVTVADPWPFPDEFFDAVISNQVLEHVGAHDQFFSEIRRTLRPGGFSAHLSPLRECLWEWHVHLPLVHRIRNYDLLRACITLCSRLGLGKYRSHRGRYALSEYCESHADYIHYFTNYLSYREALSLAKKHGMRGSFRHTPELYTRKARRVIGGTPGFTQRDGSQAFRNWLAVLVLKRVSSVTLTLEKAETYTLRHRE
jgi:SAM-dependent methyltransferase